MISVILVTANERKEPTAMDLEQGWTHVQKGIKKLKNVLEGLTEEPFNSEEYLNCYTAIYNICIKNSTVDVDYQQQMYDRYKEILEEYLNSMVLPALRNNQGELMLRELINRWVNHKIMVRRLSRFFMYLDRFFVVRKKLPNLNEVGRICFLHQVYEEMKNNIKDAMITLIDQALLKNVTGFFMEIGMGSKDAYESHFEPAMLTNTAAYYSRKSASWIDKYSFPDYMLKTEDCLKKEKERVGNYLHELSEPKLLEIVQHELLIQFENQLMEKEHPTYYALLSDDKVVDLSRMYRLFCKIPKELAATFRQHIAKEGTTLVKQAEDAAINKKAENKDACGGQEQGAFVNKVIELHDKYLRQVSECFINDTHFMKALKKAFEVFCNKSVAGRTSAELLATFCDDLLMQRSSKRLSNQDFEEIIEKVVKILAYINDKDLFAELYRKKMGPRLLSHKYKCEDQELGILTKLKAQFGGLFTSKLERMVADLSLTREIQASFEDYLGDNPALNPGIQLNVTLLTTGIWPDYSYLDLPLPVEMVKCVEVFNQFYQTSSRSRKLTWIYSLGTCALNVQFDSKPIELIVTTHQAAMLVLFNEAESLTYADIKGHLNLGDEAMMRLLYSLSCGKHKILKKKPSTISITPEDSFELNSKFTNKMSSIRIPLPPLDERRRVIADVDKNRCYAVDACIVRIMKILKTCAYQQLQAESVGQLEQNYKFKPDFKLIKTRVENLIDRGFLERDLEYPNMLKYLA